MQGEEPEKPTLSGTPSEDRRTLEAREREQRELDQLYRLGPMLGQGGMANIYEAWRLSDELHVAIKVLQLPKLISVDESNRLKKRFYREARLISSLEELHIVKCVDYGSFQDIPCMVLEFVQGKPLDAYLRDYGPLPVAYATGIVRQLLLALAYSHERGIIHRDVKPSNIMLFDMPPPFEIRVLDFGIASVLEGIQQMNPLLTQNGTLLGTPAYMAPELFTGEVSATPQSDIYAAGLVLLEALTARVAFFADNFLRTAFLHLNQDIELPPYIAPALARFIQRCTAKTPEKRYASAREALDALEACTEDALAFEEGYEKAQKPSKTCKKAQKGSRRLSLVLVMLLVLVFLGLAAFWAFPQLEEKLFQTQQTPPNLERKLPEPKAISTENSPKSTENSAENAEIGPEGLVMNSLFREGAQSAARLGAACFFESPKPSNSEKLGERPVPF